MTLEENKALVRRYLESNWGKRDFSIIDELVAPDFVQHAATVNAGREGITQFFRMVHGGLPDLQFTLNNLLADGDMVSTRFTIRGTHQGPLFGIPATGKPIMITGMSLLRLRDGKIVENWNEVDMLSALQQLGVIPPIGAPRPPQ